ncbi:MAG: DUF4235 domain-containing protein [Solirubrobacteraceae bacterium]
MITKLLFLPFSIAAGLLGGLVSRRAFALAWGAIDDQQPPRPEERRARLGKLALALALEGAVYRLAKGLVDHASRGSFAQLTGRWPGEKRSEEQGQEPA